MYITFKDDIKIKVLLMLVLLCDAKMFILAGTRFFDGFLSYYLVRFLTLFGSLIFFDRIQTIFKEYKFYGSFFLYIVITQIILTIYSVYTYKQKFSNVFAYSGLYLTLLLVALLIIGFEILGFDRTLKILFGLEIIRDVIIVLDATIYNIVGVKVIQFSELTSKTQFIRIEFGALFPLLVIYLFYNLLVELDKKKLVIILLCMLAEYYVQNTRAIEIGLVIAFIVMWVSHSGDKITKYLKIVMILCGLGGLLYLGVVEMVLNSFSADPSINEHYASTLARIGAINYYSSYLFRHPLFGMGWIMRNTDYLKYIASGPLGIYHYDDLGILGQVFRQGLLGLIIYLIFLGRLIYISMNLKNMRGKVFVIGITSYVISTVFSLNAFDVQRVLVASFYIAISEYIWKKSKEGINEKEI
ncbi:hypothetical protein [Pseudobutyrivibrio sp.]|uniref:hypothetical protein n=1 Tax=Pseudobutyrivibrio sp. TaxID=2014367 RepID=UPI001B56831B|nr:hypothetical protein [Pseudobutyrivibrio sp.]MBP3263085.1 hypothetical protein [Pseudobutyrivibrio sp.]